MNRPSREQQRPPIVQQRPTAHMATDAEIASLGSMLISTPACDEVLGILGADDYYSTPHRIIFAAIQRMRNADPPEPVDTLTVKEELQRAGQLDTIGGFSVVLDLAAAPDTARHAGHYARLVKRAANKRRLSEAGERIQRLSEGEEGDDEALTLAADVLDKLRAHSPRERPKPQTAEELAAAVFEPVKFVVDRYFPQGLVLLHSPPKLGKTRLMDALALAVSAGGRFLGKLPVDRSGVLALLLEDTDQSAQERLLQALGDQAAPVNLYYHFSWPRWNEGGGRELDEFLTQHPEVGLVVIDTFQMIRPPRRQNGDLYDEDVWAVRAMKDLADRHGVCMVVLHHSRKGSADGDLIDGAGGTSGVTASADTIMRLRRPDAFPDDEALLEGRGRRVREFCLHLKMHSMAGWQLVGTADEVQHSREETEVLDLIREYGSITPAQLKDELGITRAAAGMRLRRMKGRRLLVKTGYGTYVADVAGVSAVTDVTSCSVAVSAPFRDSEDELIRSLPLETETATTPTTDATPVTGETRETPATGVPPNSAQRSPRVSLRLLAAEHGFPAIEAAGTQIRAGEPEWAYICREWDEGVLRQVEAELRQRAGP